MLTLQRLSQNFRHKPEELTAGIFPEPGAAWRPLSHKPGRLQVRPHQQTKLYHHHHQSYLGTLLVLTAWLLC